ncbi:hypothetical protein [Yersinia phage fHe-Yen9-04]|uniref:Uncharacterized protein n=2 Tax=Eneladusvirus Yen904 TaxID=2560849 RepID=A0A2C9CYA1_9CAUD|nr:hypothetical protein FDJ41_gp404 [Yersinia phage fHe-Yen9-04]SOK58776.1 hypothetical protein [Yersinia phage fHe-Yen9-04]SOK59312.1 hypothetical protein [Yersinia phage fHe-Yen9-03]VUE36545.1 hypothetical protein [Yersinia phage fHe-Yen9-04]
MSRRGKISTILNYTIDELVQMMMSNDILKENIRLYQKNYNMNEITKRHAMAAYKAFKKYKKQVRDEEKIKRIKLNKELRIMKYNEDNPLSFRYRTVEEIYVLIRDNQSCFNLAWNYVSPCKTKTKLEPLLIERTRKALVRYYKKKDRNNPKLKKLLDRDPANI